MKETCFRIDQEFAGHMHRLKPEEEAQLEANLLRDGCRDALVVWQEEGVLLDGHNRHRICEQHNLPYEVKTISLPDRRAALVWILETQLGRRNCAPYERAELALKLKPEIAEKAKENKVAAGKYCGRGQQKVSHPGEKPIDTNKEVATKAGVSHYTIAKAEYIAHEADDATKEKLRRGETTINAEYRRLRKLGAQEERRAKKAAAVELPDDGRVRLIRADIVDAADQIAAESVDWIITDPPYPKEFLDCYTHLGRFAAHALRPGGSLIAMIGQSYLPEIIARLGESLDYHWILTYLTPGGQAVQLWDRKVNTFWKPLLWFVKGKYTGDWAGDVCRSEVNDNDKQHHHWGQSVSGMLDILGRFVYPGQVVCDPFVGAGTTGIAAVAAGCPFIGLDIDEDVLDKAKVRISEALQVGVENGLSE